MSDIVGSYDRISFFGSIFVIQKIAIDFHELDDPFDSVTDRI